MQRAARLGAVALVLVADLSPLAAQSANRHPNAAYVTPAPRSNTVAFGTSAVVALADWPNHLIGTIGREDGPAATILGRVRQAKFLDDTTVAILDETVQEVRLFSVTGQHLQTVGRKGEGPGEFRAPQAVVLSPSGELLISDIRRNIQVFRRGPRGFEHRQTWTLPFSPRSMCFLDQRLFVNAMMLESPSVIHEVTAAGTVRQSFGSVYRSPNALVNYEFGKGHIACDVQRQLIYLMAGAGEVRAFRPNGELVWRVQVSDIRTNIVTDKPDGLTVVASPLGAHAGVGLSLVEGEGLVAMWAFRSFDQMQAKDAPTQTQLVRIAPTTGKATSLGSLPGMVLEVRGPVRLEASEDPFPKVDVRGGKLRSAAP